MNKLKLIRFAGAFGMAAFEAFVLAEILWYYLHDGEQTLHEAFSDWLHSLRERAETRVEANETLDHIRNLPETENDE